MFDAVVNFFPGVFCNCVYVYLYIDAVDVYSVYVCIVCGCSGTGFLFALTVFYIPTPFTTPHPLCQHFSTVKPYFNLSALTITQSPQAMVPHARTPKKRG